MESILYIYSSSDYDKNCRIKYYYILDSCSYFKKKVREDAMQLQGQNVHQ